MSSNIAISANAVIDTIPTNPAANDSLTLYSANTFFQRLRGLLGRSQLDINEALHIKPCSDVHTFGMRYPLDVVFIGDAGHVIDVKTVQPNRIAYCKGASSVIEFRQGAARKHGYEVNAVIADCAQVVKKSIGDRK